MKRSFEIPNLQTRDCHMNFFLEWRLVRLGKVPFKLYSIYEWIIKGNLSLTRSEIISPEGRICDGYVIHIRKSHDHQQDSPVRSYGRKWVFVRPSCLQYTYPLYCGQFECDNPWAGCCVWFWFCCLSRRCKATVGVSFRWTGVHERE